MIARRNFRYLQTRALSFLTINCKIESQKHATRFGFRYDTYSGLWCHKPMKELGFECDFVKLIPQRERKPEGSGCGAGLLRLSAAHAVLQRLLFLRQLAVRGAEHEGVEAAIVLDGADAAGRQ